MLKPVGKETLYANEYPYEFAACLDDEKVTRSARLKVELQPGNLQDMCVDAALQVGLPVINDFSSNHYTKFVEWVQKIYQPERCYKHGNLTELIETKLPKVVLSESQFAKQKAAENEGFRRAIAVAGWLWISIHIALFESEAVLPFARESGTGWQSLNESLLVVVYLYQALGRSTENLGNYVDASNQAGVTEERYNLLLLVSLLGPFTDVEWNSKGVLLLRSRVDKGKLPPDTQKTLQKALVGLFRSLRDGATMRIAAANDVQAGLCAWFLRRSQLQVPRLTEQHAMSIAQREPFSVVSLWLLFNRLLSAPDWMSCADKVLRCLQDSGVESWLGDEQFSSWEEFYTQVGKERLVSCNRDDSGLLQITFFPAQEAAELNKSQKKIEGMMQQIVRGESLDSPVFPPFESVGTKSTGLDNLFESPGRGPAPGEMHELSEGAILEVKEDCLFIYSVVKLCLEQNLRGSHEPRCTLQWTKLPGPRAAPASVIQMINAQASNFVKNQPFSLQSLWALFRRPRELHSAWKHSANHVLETIKAVLTAQETNILKVIQGSATWHEVGTKIFTTNKGVPWGYLRSRTNRTNQTIFFGLSYDPKFQLQAPTPSQEDIAHSIQEIIQKEAPACLVLSPAWPVKDNEFLAGLAELSKRASDNAPPTVLPPTLLLEIAETCLFIYAVAAKFFFHPKGLLTNRPNLRVLWQSLKTGRDRRPKLISSASVPTRPLLPPNYGAVVQRINTQALDFVVQQPFSLQSIWITISRSSEVQNEWTRSADRVLKAIKEYPTPPSKETDILQTIRGTSTWQEVLAKVFKNGNEVPWAYLRRINRTIFFGLSYDPKFELKPPTRSQKEIAQSMQEIIQEEFPACLVLSPAWPVKDQDFLAGLAELSKRASDNSSAPWEVLSPALLLEIAETCLFIFAVVTKFFFKPAGGLLRSSLKVKWQAWKPKRRATAPLLPANTDGAVARPLFMPSLPLLPTNDAVVLRRGVQEKKRRLEPTGGSALWANEYPDELAVSLGARGLEALRLKIVLEPRELHDLCTFAALQVGLPVVEDLESGKYKILADWVRTEYNVPDNKGAHAQELIEKRLPEVVLSASIYQRGDNTADIELLFAESQYYEPAAGFNAAIALAGWLWLSKRKISLLSIAVGPTVLAAQEAKADNPPRWEPLLLVIGLYRALATSLKKLRGYVAKSSGQPRPRGVLLFLSLLNVSVDFVWDAQKVRDMKRQVSQKAWLPADTQRELLSSLDSFGAVGLPDITSQDVQAGLCAAFLERGLAQAPGVTRQRACTLARQEPFSLVSLWLLFNKLLSVQDWEGCANRVLQCLRARPPSRHQPEYPLHLAGRLSSWDQAYRDDIQSGVISVAATTKSVTFRSTLPGQHERRQSQQQLALIMQQIVRNEVLPSITFPPFATATDRVEGLSPGLDNLFKNSGERFLASQLHDLNGNQLTELLEACLFVYTITQLVLWPRQRGPTVARTTCKIKWESGQPETDTRATAVTGYQSPEMEETGYQSPEMEETGYQSPEMEEDDDMLLSRVPPIGMLSPPKKKRVESYFADVSAPHVALADSPPHVERKGSPVPPFDYLYDDDDDAMSVDSRYEQPPGYTPLFEGFDEGTILSGLQPLLPPFIYGELENDGGSLGPANNDFFDFF